MKRPRSFPGHAQRAVVSSKHYGRSAIENVILSRLFCALSRYGHDNMELLRPLCLGFTRALNSSLKVAQIYTEKLDERLSEQAKDYFRRYDQFDPEVRAVSHTGKVFAVNTFDRIMYRTCLQFVDNETHYCDKKYPTRETNRPVYALCNAHVHIQSFFDLYL